MHGNSLEFNERKEECDESVDACESEEYEESEEGDESLYAVEESENDGFHVAEKSKKKR